MRTNHLNLTTETKLTWQMRTFTSKIYIIVAYENSLHACIPFNVIFSSRSIFMAMVGTKLLPLPGSYRLVDVVSRRCYPIVK